MGIRLMQKSRAENTVRNYESRLRTPASGALLLSTPNLQSFLPVHPVDPLVVIPETLSSEQIRQSLRR